MNNSALFLLQRLNERAQNAEAMAHQVNVVFELLVNELGEEGEAPESGDADSLIGRLVADGRSPVVFWQNGECMLEAWNANPADEFNAYKRTWRAPTIFEAARAALSWPDNDVTIVKELEPEDVS